MASSSATIAERNHEATLYVGGLDERVDEDLLWELFVQAGPVTSVFMPGDKVTGRHQGFGFVEFRSEEDAEYAAAVLNMVRVFGKSMRVNKSSGAAGGGPVKTLDVGANLFVSNLAPEADEKVLYDTFSAFGALARQPHVVRDATSGESRGFGFVYFLSFESSDAAIEAMTGQHLCGRPVELHYAKKKGSEELCGSQAERLLAAAAKGSGAGARPGLRPHTLFAVAPGQIVSTLPQPAAMVGSAAMQAQQQAQQMQQMQQMQHMQMQILMGTQFLPPSMGGFQTVPNSSFAPPGFAPPLPGGLAPPPLPGGFVPLPLPGGFAPTGNFAMPPPLPSVPPRTEAEAKLAGGRRDNRPAWMTAESGGAQ